MNTQLFDSPALRFCPPDYRLEQREKEQFAAATVSLVLLEPQVEPKDTCAAGSAHNQLTPSVSESECFGMVHTFVATVDKLLPDVSGTGVAFSKNIAPDVFRGFRDKIWLSPSKRSMYQQVEQIRQAMEVPHERLAKSLTKISDTVLAKKLEAANRCLASCRDSDPTILSFARFIGVGCAKSNTWKPSIGHLFSHKMLRKFASETSDLLWLDQSRVANFEEVMTNIDLYHGGADGTPCVADFGVDLSPEPASHEFFRHQSVPVHQDAILGTTTDQPQHDQNALAWPTQSPHLMQIDELENLFPVHKENPLILKEMESALQARKKKPRVAALLRRVQGERRSLAGTSCLAPDSA